MHRFLLVMIVSLASATARAGEIAITFDDAPRPDTSLFTGAERTHALIESLGSADVPEALFFVIAGSIDQHNKARLSKYTDAGHLLANHSFSHQSANQISASAFTDDFQKAHEALSVLPDYRPIFRYPFLHKGDTTEKQNTIRRHIHTAGYTIGYVTVDNYDWYMDALLQQALQAERSVDYDKLGEIYVDVLWQTIQFYDDLAVKAIGRSPKHVLLLHENDLAALYVDDLVSRIRANGWNIVPPASAYEDEIAAYSLNGQLGSQGRIAEIAKSKGIPDHELRHESENQNYLIDLFEREGVFQ